MVEIHKNEAEEIRKTIPNVVIVSTGGKKKGNRGKYYAEPTPSVLKALKRIRQTDNIVT